MLLAKMKSVITPDYDEGIVRMRTIRQRIQNHADTLSTKLIEAK